MTSVSLPVRHQVEALFGPAGLTVTVRNSILNTFLPTGLKSNSYTLRSKVRARLAAAVNSRLYAALSVYNTFVQLCDMIDTLGVAPDFYKAARLVSSRMLHGFLSPETKALEAEVAANVEGLYHRLYALLVSTTTMRPVIKAEAEAEADGAEAEAETDGAGVGAGAADDSETETETDEECDTGFGCVETDPASEAALETQTETPCLLTTSWGFQVPATQKQFQDALLRLPIGEQYALCLELGVAKLKETVFPDRFTINSLVFYEQKWDLWRFVRGTKTGGVYTGGSMRSCLGMSSCQKLSDTKFVKAVHLIAQLPDDVQARVIDAVRRSSNKMVDSHPLSDCVSLVHHFKVDSGGLFHQSQSQPQSLSPPLPLSPPLKRQRTQEVQPVMMIGVPTKGVTDWKFLYGDDERTANPYQLEDVGSDERVTKAWRDMVQDCNVAQLTLITNQLVMNWLRASQTMGVSTAAADVVTALVGRPKPEIKEMKGKLVNLDTIVTLFLHFVPATSQPHLALHQAIERLMYVRKPVVSTLREFVRMALVHGKENLFFSAAFDRIVQCFLKSVDSDEDRRCMIEDAVMMYVRHTGQTLDVKTAMTPADSRVHAVCTSLLRVATTYGAVGSA